MYAFSVNGKATRDHGSIKVDDTALFIVHINFIDLFGAETLCKVLLMREGFTDIAIEKRQWITPENRENPAILKADKGMSEALEKGYHIQMFAE